MSDSEGSAVQLGSVGAKILAGYLLALGMLLSFLIVYVWPPTNNKNTPEQPATTVVGAMRPWGIQVPLETRLLMLAVLSGAMGSNVHAVKSFIDYAGNRRLTTNWIWFYVLMPLVGMQLALLFYFVVRGGFLSAGAGAEGISPFGIAAFAGLVGLFSDQATLKLEELFKTLFKADDPRGGKLKNSNPRIQTIEPPSVEQGNTGLDVKVNGRSFVPASIVRFDGRDQQTTFVSTEELIVHGAAPDLVKPRAISVTVVNPEPGGGASNRMILTVLAKPK